MTAASEVPSLPLEQAAASQQHPSLAGASSSADDAEPVLPDSTTPAAASPNAAQLQAATVPCQFMSTLLDGQQPGGSCSGWSSLMAEACNINLQQPIIQPVLPSSRRSLDRQQLPQQQQASCDRSPGVRPGAAPAEIQSSATWTINDNVPAYQPQQLGCVQQQQQHDQSQGQPSNEPAGGQQASWQQYPGQQAPEPLPSSSFDLAMSLLGPVATSSAQQPPVHEQQPWAMGPAASSMPLTYHPYHFVSRLSLKLFNCTPADLPDDLRAQLTGWLKSAPAGAEGYMRPGCVHLTLDALVNSAGDPAGCWVPFICTSFWLDASCSDDVWHHQVNAARLS